MSQEIMGKLTGIERTLLKHGQKFEDHDLQLDIIARTLADNTERLQRIEEKLEQTSTKEDVSKLVSTFEGIIGLYNKKDQELTFMGERIKRVEQKTEQNNNDLKKIKPLVGLT